MDQILKNMVHFGFVFAASWLIMADNVRHVLQDLHIWDGPSSKEYRPGCGKEDISCLSTTGFIITIGCTYLGFICLIVGSLWNANICDILRKVRNT